MLPCNLKSTFFLFSHLIMLSVIVVSEHLGMRWVQPFWGSYVEVPIEAHMLLSQNPFSLWMQSTKESSITNGQLLVPPDTLIPFNHSHLYSLLNDKIPSFPIHGIVDNKLYNIKWDVPNKVVKPNHTSSTLCNSFNSCKPLVCIDINQGSNLLAKK